MTDIRAQWVSLRTMLVEEAVRSKQSNDVTAGLANAYRQFGAIERGVVDEVLFEWLLSTDSSYRFDAQALVRQFKIYEALPALQSLSERLKLDNSAPSRHEYIAVLEAIAELKRDAPMLN